jgi:hypothetical protein
MTANSLRQGLPTRTELELVKVWVAAIEPRSAATAVRMCVVHMPSLAAHVLHPCASIPVTLGSTAETVWLPTRPQVTRLAAEVPLTGLLHLKRVRKPEPVPGSADYPRSQLHLILCPASESGAGGAQAGNDGSGDSPWPGSDGPGQQAPLLPGAAQSRLAEMRRDANMQSAHHQRAGDSRALLPDAVRSLVEDWGLEPFIAEVRCSGSWRGVTAGTSGTLEHPELSLTAPQTVHTRMASEQRGMRHSERDARTNGGYAGQGLGFWQACGGWRLRCAPLA